MNNISYYHRSNKLQKFIYDKFKGISQFLNPNVDKCPFDIYKPKINKIKLSVGIIITIACLFTIGTNFILPFLWGWVLK